MVFRHSEQAVQENNIPGEEWKNEGIFMIALAYFLKGQNFQAAAQ